ncbi:extradiol dioxygenase [Candidatus Bathyarchaeota archaeon]|nr:MAG: extradiol dioxygenase [Candidatus Bathyarchaeota archaeon]
MIKGMHGLFYTPKAEEVRAFIRDKLGFVHTDTGEGWLIFDIPEADLGVHPSDKVSHSISFYCDDIHKTVEDLRARGVEFSSGITEEEWGSLTHFRMPGNMEVELYQPKYTKLPHRKASKPRATRRTGRKSRRMKR